MKKTLKERFEEKYIPEPMSGCWLWIYSESSFGHGIDTIKRKSKRAHRVSYELYIGEIPEGLCVLHKCDVPQCVNPKHLFLGTKKDNTQDMIKKGRMIVSGSIKTHCKRGHLLSGSNLLNGRPFTKKGRPLRICRICCNIRYNSNKRNPMRDTIKD